jgi:hypothetical protein
MLRADGLLMPAEKDQAPPDLRYFSRRGNETPPTTMAPLDDYEGAAVWPSEVALKFAAEYCPNRIGVSTFAPEVNYMHDSLS